MDVLTICTKKSFLSHHLSIVSGSVVLLTRLPGMVFLLFTDFSFHVLTLLQILIKGTTVFIPRRSVGCTGRFRCVSYVCINTQGSRYLTFIAYSAGSTIGILLHHLCIIPHARCYSSVSTSYELCTSTSYMSLGLLELDLVVHPIHSLCFTWKDVSKVLTINLCTKASGILVKDSLSFRSSTSQSIL